MCSVLLWMVHYCEINPVHALWLYELRGFPATMTLMADLQ